MKICGYIGSISGNGHDENISLLRSFMLYFVFDYKHSTPNGVLKLMHMGRFHESPYAAREKRGIVRNKEIKEK